MLAARVGVDAGRAGARRHEAAGAFQQGGKGSSVAHRRHWPLVLISVLTALLAVPLAVAPQEVSPAASSAALPRRPNIVLVVTDDQDARAVEAMPTVMALLHEQGVRFTHFFASTPLCCPARVSLLRGQYAHNHGVLGNGGPNGGFATFRRLGGEDSTVATWLHDAGYRTALLGKYLNGYPEDTDPTYVPPGWDEWDALAVEAPAGGGYVDYELNENGRRVAYGHDAADYSTDVLAAKATDFIARTTAADQPFFLYLAPFAPHDPRIPAPRHGQAFAEAWAPRSAAFNEADVSDKPGWVRDRPVLSDEQVAEIDARYRDRLRTLLAVDEMVATLVETLEATGELENTYLFFTSDNGFHLGEHRLPIGKETPYEAAVRVPLLVRGPGVPAGIAVDSLALNVDLAPTLAELAGVPVPPFVDGRSLVPLLRGSPPTGWRQAVLLEFFGVIRDGGLGTPSVAPAVRDATPVPEEDGEVALLGPRAPPYRALRTPGLLYIEYAGEVRELYDLRADPQELENLAGRADSALLTRLSARLAELRGCVAATCRVVEDAPLDVILDRAPIASPTAVLTTEDGIEVVLRDARDREVGRATVVERPDGAVTVHVDVGALTPGEHGIHVHEAGICDPSEPTKFASAGEHDNPTGTTHGGPPASGHAGDLGNIVADQVGFAELELITDRFGMAELHDADGSALVIHAARDDLTTDPEGSSGSRLVCGVLAPPQSPRQGTPAPGTPAATRE
jgi:N-acetylglucosamine-6-sulfatase